MEALNNTLSKIPFLAIAILYCAWLGYDFREWQNSTSSELGQKKALLGSLEDEIKQQKQKLKAAEDFYQSIDTVRTRIRQLTTQLESTKTTLSADIDIANFVRMITLEAKKLSLSIKGIKPLAETKKEYYIEVPFSVNMRGAYVQMLVFFDRIAKFQQVIRVSDFNMKPTGSNLTKYVELDGTVKLVAYKYLGSSADEIINKETMKPNSRTPAPPPAKGGRK